MEQKKIKSSAYIYTYCLTLVAAALFLISQRYYSLASFPIILFWGILIFIIGSLYVKLEKGATSTVNFAIFFSAILLFGPLTTAAISIFEAFTWQNIIGRSKRQPIQSLFNISQFIISSISSGFTYKALGGIILTQDNTGFTLVNFPSQIIPLTAAIVVFYLINTSLVSIVIALNKEISVKDVWLLSFSWGDLNYLALGFFGIILAQIYFFEPLAMVLLIIPLAIARQTFSRYMQLEEAYSSTIGALIKAIEAKDPYTKGHSERVANLSTEIGRAINLSEKQVEELKRIAALHDIGKIGVPKKILLKPQALTEQEFDSIKEHPRIGARILKDVHFLKDLIPAVYYHHEKVDGTGYNSGLLGRNIPLFARIITLADSYDAMTSNRAYRKALSREEVINQLRSNAGTQFDNSLVNALLHVIDTEPDKTKQSEVKQPVLVH